MSKLQRYVINIPMRNTWVSLWCCLLLLHLLLSEPCNLSFESSDNWNVVVFSGLFTPKCPNTSTEVDSHLKSSMFVQYSGCVWSYPPIHHLLSLFWAHISLRHHPGCHIDWRDPIGHLLITYSLFFSLFYIYSY